MDDDEFEFGSDVADEDLMLAYEASSTTAAAAATSRSTAQGTFQPASAFARPSLPRPGHGATRQNGQHGQNGQNSIGRNPVGQNQTSQNQNQNGQSRRPLQPAQPHEELDDLPSDAFDSSFVSPGGAQHSQRSIISSIRQPIRIPSQQTSFRQTTLHGDTLHEKPSQPQHTSNYAYVADMGPEKVTHHKIDTDAMQTWVYPTNLGAIRDYQFSIVKSSLFSNTLVALPTGLGKTFIAATVILNFYRWTRDAKLVFVAPTKPLVSQQVDACLQVAGIPRSDTTLLTGETSPALREAEWASKRLFFMTPQTLQNDLSKGYADPKSIALLVIDEAHRSTGEYAYVKVVGFMRRFTNSFRVLALTATPGASVESVQEVIDNLGVSHVEIRTEESIDIRNYVHSREIERLSLEPSLEMETVQDLFSKALKPFCDRLSQQNIWFGRDPMALTTFGLMKAQREWMAGPARHLNDGTKFMLLGTFGLLKSLAHPIKLLSFHSIRACYNSLHEMRSECEKNEKGSKLRKQFFRDPNAEEMMMTIERWLKDPTFESHPKLSYLKQQLAEHFIDQAPGANTRAIVFNEFRDSAEDIVRALNRDVPNVKASVFVGQADSKRSAGMKQADQIKAIQRFKDGEFNVLVATSIGEEGLDIGQVDLIVCYDASSSPIRMLQRMGRTGRKRAGHVILLLMKGKEEDKFAEAQDKYTGIQKLICDGARFNFRDDLSERIVPRSIKPTVDKRHVEIPVENTQNLGLPEPKKRAGRLPKTSKKKFHMPDDAETGFVTASTVNEVDGQTKLGFRTAGTAARAGANAKAKTKTKTKAAAVKAPIAKAPDPAELEFLVDIPDLETALQSARASRKRTGGRAGASFSSFISSFGGAQQEPPAIDTGDSANFGKLQRTSYLEHGVYTRRNVQLINRLGKGAYDRPRSLGDAYMRQKVPRFVTDSGVSEDEDNDVDEDAAKDQTNDHQTKSESDEDMGQVFAARPSAHLNSRVNSRPATSLSLPRTVVRPTRPAEPAPLSPEPDAKRRRTAGPAYGAAKKTQRERLTVTPYYGGSNENTASSVKAEYDDDDDVGGSSSRWASKKKNSRPAVKGMTKWRSSQFQSYSFMGARDDDVPEHDGGDDEDMDDFPAFSLKSKAKTTKARAALPQYNARPGGTSLLTRPVTGNQPVAKTTTTTTTTTTTAKATATRPQAKAKAPMHNRLMAEFSESEGEEVEDEDEMEMELELERDRERRRVEEEQERQEHTADDSFDFMDDDLERDMDALLAGNVDNTEAMEAVVEVSDSDVDLPEPPRASQRVSQRPQPRQPVPRPGEPSTDISEPSPEPAMPEMQEFFDLEELPDAPDVSDVPDVPDIPDVPDVPDVQLPSFARREAEALPFIPMSHPPAYGEPVTASYNPNSMYSMYNKKHGYKEHNDYGQADGDDDEHSSQPMVIKFSQPAGTGNSLRRGPSRGRARASRGAGRAGRGGRGGVGGRGGRGAREYSAILEDEAEEAGFDSYDEYGDAYGGKRGKGKKGRGKLEEQGDDCMRTSDNYESDGSDSGGDLLDFVVDDDEEEEEAESELPSSFVEPKKAAKRSEKTGKTGKTKTRETASRPKVKTARNTYRIPSSVASSPPVRATTLPIRLSQTMDSASDEDVPRVSTAKTAGKKTATKAKTTKAATKPKAPSKPKATKAKASRAKAANMPPPKSAEFILSEDDLSSDAVESNNNVVNNNNDDDDDDESDVPVQRSRRRQVVDSDSD
ncbi:atp-dependent dna helicase mph1 [Ophiostoma piceae UAMH 11346]|uniref:ATP-dependent DNA helicase MPH1 n=1 Tax=Ophiostoma piceae (strain UAMH 11346) TaxID=1262450 RepID=S3C2V4_OPHP1|nr:atp-dependent dna helicase mph1 [Ophiostoma piceae UAMH 11346]